MSDKELIDNIKSGKGLPPYDEYDEIIRTVKCNNKQSDLIKEYISYLIAWITGHCDLELDPLTEFQVIRVIMDSYECFEKERNKDGND